MDGIRLSLPSGLISVYFLLHISISYIYIYIYAPHLIAADKRIFIQRKFSHPAINLTTPTYNKEPSLYLSISVRGLLFSISLFSPLSLSFLQQAWESIFEDLLQHLNTSKRTELCCEHGRSGKEAERVNKKGPQVLLLGRGVCTCITHVVRISLFTLCLYWQKYKSL